MPSPITIFISYAHKDEAYLTELQTFLRPYERNKVIRTWTDKNIVAGQPWDQSIKSQLDASKIILLLVSPDFLASDYINDIEIKNALITNRTVIPVIIRPIDMDLLHFNYLQAIPSGAKAVADWDSRDKAWNDVLEELKAVFDQINEVETDRPDDSGNGPVVIKKRNNFSDTLLKVLFVALIAVSIFVFAIGLITGIERFYSYTSFAGMSAGFGGYIVVRKF